LPAKLGVKKLVIYGQWSTTAQIIELICFPVKKFPILIFKKIYCQRKFSIVVEIKQGRKQHKGHKRLKMLQRKKIQFCRITTAHKK
jgi:hypothetical protein